jgi:hypothetical protein
MIIIIQADPGDGAQAEAAVAATEEEAIGEEEIAALAAAALHRETEAAEADTEEVPIEAKEGTATIVAVEGTATIVAVEGTATTVAVEGTATIVAVEEEAGAIPRGEAAAEVPDPRPDTAAAARVAAESRRTTDISRASRPPLAATGRGCSSSRGLRPARETTSMTSLTVSLRLASTGEPMLLYQRKGER